MANTLTAVGDENISNTNEIRVSWEPSVAHTISELMDSKRHDETQASRPLVVALVGVPGAIRAEMLSCSKAQG